MQKESIPSDFYSLFGDAGASITRTEHPEGADDPISLTDYNLGDGVWSMATIRSFHHKIFRYKENKRSQEVFISMKESLEFVASVEPDIVWGTRLLERLPVWARKLAHNIRVENVLTADEKSTLAENEYQSLRDQGIVDEDDNAVIPLDEDEEHEAQAMRRRFEGEWVPKASLGTDEVSFLTAFDGIDDTAIDNTDNFATDLRQVEYSLIADNDYGYGEDEYGDDYCQAKLMDVWDRSFPNARPYWPEEEDEEDETASQQLTTGIQAVEQAVRASVRAWREVQADRNQRFLNTESDIFRAHHSRVSNLVSLEAFQKMCKRYWTRTQPARSALVLEAYHAIFDQRCENESSSSNELKTKEKKK